MSVRLQAPIVLVTPRAFRALPGRHWEILREAGCVVRESPSDRPLQPHELAALIEDVDALIVGLDRVNEEVLRRANRLRIIAKFGVGTDNIDVEGAYHRRILVTTTPGANADSVAELTLALVLALARSVVIHHVGLQRGRLERRIGMELQGKVWGLIGLGRVGKAVARRAVALGLSVVAHDPYPDREFAQAHRIALLPMDELLKRSDIVSLHCPLTPETRGLLGARELSLMRPTAYLVNTARKELIDLSALYEALKEGRLAGAACDTFDQPEDLQSPLLTLSNFIGSPHAGAATREAALRMAEMAAEEVVRVLQGEAPRYAISPLCDKGVS